jgi:hypothetical protein
MLIDRVEAADEDGGVVPLSNAVIWGKREPRHAIAEKRIKLTAFDEEARTNKDRQDYEMLLLTMGDYSLYEEATNANFGSNYVEKLAPKSKRIPAAAPQVERSADNEEASSAAKRKKAKPETVEPKPLKINHAANCSGCKLVTSEDDEIVWCSGCFVEAHIGCSSGCAPPPKASFALDASVSCEYCIGTWQNENGTVNSKVRSHHSSCVRSKCQGVNTGKKTKGDQCMNKEKWPGFGFCHFHMSAREIIKCSEEVANMLVSGGAKPKRANMKIWSEMKEDDEWMVAF